MPTLLHGPGCNLGSGTGCPPVVHYWADLQSVYGLRCYGNLTRTPNVSEYMLVLAVCLVKFVLSLFIYCMLPFSANKDYNNHYGRLLKRLLDKMRFLLSF